MGICKYQFHKGSYQGCCFFLEVFFFFLLPGFSKLTFGEAECQEYNYARGRATSVLLRVAGGEVEALPRSLAHLGTQVLTRTGRWTSLWLCLLHVHVSMCCKKTHTSGSTVSFLCVIWVSLEPHLHVDANGDMLTLQFPYSGSTTHTLGPCSFPHS